MSEENKNLGEEAKDAAKKATDKASKAASELKEEVKDFGKEAKESAKEFADNAKETFNSSENKKVLAGILAILIGSLGIHKFILGYTKEGIIQIIISIVTCGIGGIIPFVEGIIYLTKSDEEFYQTYQVGKRPWF